MKVCFFIATLNNSGGVERITTTIANELVMQGYDVSIISWWGGKESFFPLNSKIQHTSIFADNKINIYTAYLQTFIRYKRLVKQIKPSIIIDVCVPLSLITIPATRFKKIKVISWEHFNVKVSWNFFTSKIARRLASKYAEKIVVLTNGDKEQYEKRFAAKNVVVIKNPVPIVVKSTSPLTSKNVLAVGRLTHQKGFDLLLKAWKILKSEGERTEVDQWKLNMVGGGEDELALKQLCAQLNIASSVNFIPPTKHIEKYYLDASLFVMSSRFEGLPLALIEAKAFGLPTIAFDCETGPREIITHEEDGLLVEAESESALATSISILIRSPLFRSKYSEASIARVKDFRLPEVMKQWHQLLN